MFLNWCNYYNFILNPLFPLCAYNIYDVVIECQRPQSNKIFVYISPVLHWYVLSGITGLFVIIIFIFDPYTVLKSKKIKKLKFMQMSYMITVLPFYVL